MRIDDGLGYRNGDTILTFAVAICALLAATQGPTLAQHRKSPALATLISQAPALSESELLEMTEDPEPEIRQYAVLRLAEIEPLNETVLAKLTAALGDEAEIVRLQALAGLMRIGRPATRALLRVLADFDALAKHTYFSEDYNRWRTVPISRSDLAFVTLAFARSTDVDALIESFASLDAPEPDEKRSRIRALSEVMPVELTRNLHEALRDGSILVKVSAARMFARAGAESAEAVPILIRAVIDDHDDVSEAAASALAAMEPGGTEALRTLLAHPEARIRRIALDAYPAERADAAALLAGALEDPDPRVVRAALDRMSCPECKSEKGEDVLRYQYRAVCRPPWEEPRHVSILAELSEKMIDRVERAAMADAPELRAAALAALTSVACSQAAKGPEIADFLVSRITDPVAEIADLAAFHLDRLADLGVFPGSVDDFYRVLASVVLQRTPAGVAEEPGVDAETRQEEGRPADLLEALGYLGATRAEPPRVVPRFGSNLLSVLKVMDLPGEPRAEWIAETMHICLDENRCEPLEALLGNRSEWKRAALRELVKRRVDPKALAMLGLDLLGELAAVIEETELPDELRAVWIAETIRLCFKEYQCEPLEALLESGEPTSALELQNLLDHPDQEIRTRAALCLADLRGPGPRILEVLEAALVEEKLSSDWNASARALAHSGERGVARLIALLEDDPSTAAGWVIVSHLSELIEQSPLAAQALLRFAANGDEPELQIASISALVSKRSHYDPKVLEGIVFSALVSEDADVRAEAIRALPILPPDDPLRIAATKAAIGDGNLWTRDEALEQAGELGEAGALMLAEYATRGGTLSYSFFVGAYRLGAPNQALVVALDGRSAHAAPNERLAIDGVLSRARSKAWVNLERLYERLEHAELADRESAAGTLLLLGEDPWDAGGGKIAAVLMDAQVRKVVQDRLALTLDKLFPSWSNLSSIRRETLPLFPWPPPAGYQRVIIPRNLIAASEAATLGDVYHVLVDALMAASDGFEHGLFKGVPGGFALVARMERIRGNGEPLPEPYRWVKEGMPRLSLWEFLGDLFFEQPGYFRVIVFAVTDDVVPGQNPNAGLPEPEGGAPSIPPELAAKPFEGQEVLALIYSFERRRDAKVSPWKNGNPSALQHLKRAGVWGAWRAPR